MLAASFFRYNHGGNVMVKINSENFDVAGMSVSEYLKTTNYQQQYIAIELNSNILPKKDYDSTILNNGDTLEIVNFVGGG